MKRKHQVFPRVFDFSCRRNPEHASQLPSELLLFHIVRGQQMMPKLINGQRDPVQVSSAGVLRTPIVLPCCHTPAAFERAVAFGWAVSEPAFLPRYAGLGASRVILTFRSWCAVATCNPSICKSISRAMFGNWKRW